MFFSPSPSTGEGWGEGEIKFSLQIETVPPRRFN